MDCKVYLFSGHIWTQSAGDKFIAGRKLSGTVGSARSEWMKRLIICLWLSNTGHCLGAESDLPCDNLNDPNSLSTLCGFSKPEDVQFIASKSVVIVSEQGWKQPNSGGYISIVDVDGRAGRLGTRHALWPPAKVEPSHGKLIGDPSCVIAPVE